MIIRFDLPLPALPPRGPFLSAGRELRSFRVLVEANCFRPVWYCGGHLHSFASPMSAAVDVDVDVVQQHSGDIFPSRSFCKLDLTLSRMQLHGVAKPTVYSAIFLRKSPSSSSRIIVLHKASGPCCGLGRVGCQNHPHRQSAPSRAQFIMSATNGTASWASHSQELF